MSGFVNGGGGGGGSPSGPAGGVLSGTYPNPSFTNPEITDLIFDSSHGVTSTFIKSTGSNIASAGFIRLENNINGVSFRNAGNTANITGLATDSSDNLFLGDVTNTVRSKILASTAVQLAMITPSLEIGTTNLSTIGDLKFQPSTARTILGIRNAGNTADVSLISVDVSNNIYYGRTSAGTSLANAVTIDAATSFTLGVNTTPVISSTSTTLTTNNNTTNIQAGGSTKLSVVAATSTFGNSVVLTGTNPAVSGDIRAVNNTTIIGARNAGNTADIICLATDGSNNLSVGDTTNTIRTKLASSTAVQIAMTTPVLEMGSGNVATTGSIRLLNAVDGVVFRNGANSANLTGLALNSSNQLLIGAAGFSSGRVVSAIVDGSTDVQLQNQGSSKLTVNGSTVTTTLPIVLEGTNPATVGDIRAVNNTTILAARNAANTADITALATDAANNLFFGRAAAGAVRSTNNFFDSTTTQNMQIAGLSVLTLSNNTINLGINATIIDIQPAGTSKIKANTTGVGFYNTTPVAQQTVGAVTNNVTAGGVDGTIANFTDLSTYSNDAATIRNDIYQLARSVVQIVTALRNYGLGV